MNFYTVSSFESVWSFRRCLVGVGLTPVNPEMRSMNKQNTTAMQLGSTKGRNARKPKFTVVGRKFRITTEWHKGKAESK